jgi:hypothetical protein
VTSVVCIGETIQYGLRPCLRLPIGTEHDASLRSHAAPARLGTGGLLPRRKIARKMEQGYPELPICLLLAGKSANVQYAVGASESRDEPRRPIFESRNVVAAMAILP